MSDFITHLLDRHFGKGERVQPRARSRFEPGASASFLSIPLEENIPSVSSPVSASDPSGGIGSKSEKGIDERIPVNTKKSPDTTTDSRPELEVDLGLTHDYETSTEIHPNKGFPDQDRGEPRVYPIFPGSLLSSNMQELPEAEEMIPVVPLLRESARQEATSQKKEPIDVNTSAVLNQVIPVITLKMPGETPAGQSRQQQPTAPGPTPITGTAGEPIGLESVLEMPAGFTEAREPGPEVRGMLEVPVWAAGEYEIPKDSLNYSQPAKEPVINVTIGRIEVRATRPPAPEPPPRREKPSGIMTLDQYLHRCKQGGKP